MIKSLKESVLDRIRSEHIRIRPKWSFILKAFLVGLFCIILVLTTLYLGSFILFMMLENGIWDAHEFGVPGIHLLLTSLPWLLIGLLCILMLILEILVRKHSLGYHQPLFITTIGIIIMVGIMSYIISLSRLHQSLSRLTEQSDNTFGQQFYRKIGHPLSRDIHMGTIEKLSNDSFTLNTIRGEHLTVLMNPYTRISRSIKLIEGDRVVVYGNRNADVISAFGIRKRDTLPLRREMRRERNTPSHMY